MRPAAVCSVVLDDAGRVLLQRRRDNGEWALPGGGIELDETAADAVVREIEEETGARAEVVRLIGVYSDPARTTVSYPDGNVGPVRLRVLRVPGGRRRAKPDGRGNRVALVRARGGREVIWSIHVDRLANGLAGREAGRLAPSARRRRCQALLFRPPSSARERRRDVRAGAGAPRLRGRRPRRHHPELPAGQGAGHQPGRLGARLRAEHRRHERLRRRPRAPT